MAHSVPDDLLSAGQDYEALFVPALFEVWTEHVLAGAGVKKGSHVLDVACGTGVLARYALAQTGSDGRVVGTDPAPGMLAVAQALEPAIEWALCPAEALKVEDSAFDCLVSQFGMMFFEDRQKAVNEMYRALKSGGTLAMAIWRSLEHNPTYADAASLLETQVGTAAADALRMPFSLGDAEPVSALLKECGFVNVAAEARTESARFPSLRQMMEAELRGWLPLFDIQLTERKIAEVLTQAELALGQYAAPNGMAIFNTSAHIFTAAKP